MKFDFTKGKNSSYFESLRENVIFAELPVAGKTLQQAQIDYLELHEHEYNCDNPELLLEDNFWYYPEDLDRLIRGEELSNEKFSYPIPLGSS